MSRMTELLEEYNRLTGKNVKRFASVANGERRLAAARAEQPAPEPTKHASCEVLVEGPGLEGAARFHSVAKAFEALGLPMNKHKAFRKTLKANKQAAFGEFIFRVPE